METLTSRLHSLDQQLTEVSQTTAKTTQTVAKAVSSAGKITQAVATLLDFDEINRLKEKTVSTGSSRSSAGETGKVKTGPSPEYEFDLKLAKPPKDLASEFWTQFRLGLQEADDGGQEAGRGLIQRLGQGIKEAFGSVGAWVTEHIWNPIQTAWTGLGAVAVTIGARLSNTAGELWNMFLTAWQTGSGRAVQIWNSLTSSAGTLWQNFQAAWGSGRAVQILNSLTSSAAALWQSFKSGWGAPSVSISNVLANSAASLWNQFKTGWSNKTLSLKITYSTNVGAVKQAVYKALGLSGWPTISFAARGGIVNAATLLGNTVVGEAGKEAIIPLENHTEWIDMVADRLRERNSDPSGDGRSITINVYPQIDGKTVGECSVTYINGITRTTGRCPVAV